MLKKIRIEIQIKYQELKMAICRMMVVKSKTIPAIVFWGDTGILCKQKIMELTHAFGKRWEFK